MPLNTEPLGAQTYQLLLGEILAGKRLEGEKISEESIAREFGISRTPAREALLRLASDALIERTARKGCRVKRIDREGLRDLFQCRAMLEELALKLGFDRIPAGELGEVEAALGKARRTRDAAASLEADDRLHGAILAACPNRTLASAITRLQHQCHAFRALRAASTDVAALTDERLAIVRAISAGQKKAAGLLLSDHILQGAPK
jgi:DNA-binding GntR family transcriptional regulator